MAQYTTGTITTAVGSSTIVGANLDWTQIRAGDRIIVNQDPVSYEIATITVSTSTLTLTSNYPTLQVDVSYVIYKDFTSQLGLPLLNANDQKTADIYNRAMNLLDAAATPGGLNWKGAFANAAARDVAIPSPEALDLCFLYDVGKFYTYPVDSWVIWDVSAVSVGVPGLNGYSPTFGWVSTTQLEIFINGVSQGDPVELKGDTGATGGLHWGRAWALSVFYEVDVIAPHNSVNYICILDHVAIASTEPGVGASWATYWDVFTSPFTAGTMTGMTDTFVNADLDVSKHLIFAHGIGSTPVHVTIINGSNKEVGPDITQTDANTIDVDFSGWPALVGTYKIIVSGVTP